MTSQYSCINNTISIHQPAFFPWYPFFQKIKQSNKFIFLTHCQFEKNGYQNRFNINSKWYTMSVKKGNIPISNKKYANYERDWKKIKKSLFNKYGSILNEFDNCISEQLCKTNIQIIKKICEILEISQELLLDFETSLKSTDRLVEICKNNNAEKYLSGVSGKNYLEIKKFNKNNIEVIFQKEDEMIKKPIFEVIKDVY